MSQFRQLALVLAVAILVGAAWLIDLPTLLGGAQTPDVGRKRKAQPRPEAIVRAVTFSSDAGMLRAVGTARAVRSVTLFPEGSGQVTEMLFSAGQKIRDGAPLLRLDAEAETLAVELARLKLEDARQELARYEPLVASSAVSRRQIYQVRTELRASQIALALAELALSKRQVVAPFTGVIGIPEVEIGQRVTSETPIAAYDDRANMLIDFAVPEVFARGVRIGAPVSVSAWAGQEQPLVGHVKTIGSRIDPVSRSLRVRALVRNVGDRYRPGMSFSVTLASAGREFPAVSTVAVQWDQEGAFVWRIRDGKAETVRVKVLKRSNGKMLLDGPLSPGDLVVVEGVQRLRPGREVRVRQAPEQTASGSFHGN